MDLLLECHGRIRQFVALAREAGERRDLTAADVAEACSRVERYFVEALPLHVRDEEDSILPRLSGRSSELDQALSKMQAEHQEHEPALARLLSACRAVRAAPDDPLCRRELGQTAAALGHAFDGHLELEETVVFPALRDLLTEAARADITSELRARRQAS